MEDEIFVGRQVLVQGGVLKDDADGVADPVRLLHAVEPVHGGAARCGREKRAEYVYGRGLSRAVGAEKAEDGSFLDGKGDAVHGPQRAVILDKVVYLYDGGTRLWCIHSLKL